MRSIQNKIFSLYVDFESTWKPLHSGRIESKWCKNIKVNKTVPFADSIPSYAVAMLGFHTHFYNGNSFWMVGISLSFLGFNVSIDLNIYKDERSK